MPAERLPDLDALSDIYLLEGIKGFGPQKFKELEEDNVSVADLLARPYELQRFGKRGADFRSQLDTLGAEGRKEATQRAQKQLNAANSTGGSILTYGDRYYPRNLYESNTPVPVLYVRGDLDVLKHQAAVACVGSRNIRPPYSKLHEAFAKLAVSRGHMIVSGFATGADIVGHLAAYESGGKTVCVMPSGLDRPFPPEHKAIWHRFLESDRVAFISEFGFGTGANSLNLRKRNKTIVAMSRGVLVSQSSEDGGAMNAYRFAIEQHKPVATFLPDETPDTSGNDLIGGSAEKVRATTLRLKEGPEWAEWLRSL